MDEDRGGFWSITMYTGELFMMTDPPNGRSNVGTVDLDADEFKFDDGGSLTLVFGRDEPTDAVASANWLPAPDGAFALCLRTYVCTEEAWTGGYTLPNVERVA